MAFRIFVDAASLCCICCVAGVAVAIGYSCRVGNFAMPFPRAYLSLHRYASAWLFFEICIGAAEAAPIQMS